MAAPSVAASGGASQAGGRGVALVTGAGTGIGLAVCLRLSRLGFSVGCLDANADTAASAADAVSAAGGRSVALHADVRDGDAVADAVSRCEAALGPLGVCVANAGIARVGSVLTMDAAEWSAVFDVNCAGAFNTVKACSRAMVRAGRGGRIVTVASANSVIAERGAAAYCGSKAALAMMSRCWAQDLVPYGITVNCVGPGATDTALMRAQLPDADAERGLLEALPTGRMATPDEVARAVAYFCADDAGYVAGAFLLVDGGLRDHNPSTSAVVTAERDLLAREGGPAALAAADAEHARHVESAARARDTHSLL